MFTGLDIPFDRITYKDGQLLRSSDMRDDLRRADRLRDLHTRYLHETWGIALGLDVYKPRGIPYPDYMKMLYVNPGYAVDGMGRDIVLSKSKWVRAPNTYGAETFALSVMRPADSESCDRLDRDLEGHMEGPVFAWRKPDELIPGLHVPLVKAVVQSGEPGGLDYSVRRYARRLVRPHVGLGSTRAGGTDWKVWSLKSMQLGLEVCVDTSEGGFISTPYYFATLHGDSSAAYAAPVRMNSSPFPEGLRSGFIMNCTRVGFKYRIIMLGEDPGSKIDADEYKQWFISWIGIEPVTGAEPPRED
jgi:hypothetical protein